jgi:hypothetical protein
MPCRRANMIEPSGRSTGLPWRPRIGTRHAAVRLMWSTSRKYLNAYQRMVARQN